MKGRSRVHVEALGPTLGPVDVEPILLIHGFTGSHESWGAHILGELSARGPVLAVDLPGHGRSDLPTDPADYRIERLVEDLVVMLDERGVARADWVGYSMGGRVALAATLLQPERVHRLVLESASPGIEDEDERDTRRVQDEALAREIESRGIEWFVDYWMGLALFVTQRRVPEGVRAEARERRLRNRADVLAAALRGAGTGSQPSYWARLREIGASTLLLTGSVDTKYDALGARMATAIPLAEHRSMAGAGHAVHLEAPYAWLREVTSFLDGL